ncbi:RNA polymerase sigma factor [Demequina aestuarii]|uniref:RNA polymerase sigma factor n=1 Tax=Demequina aestuarii TaxID=327095 RepID=UPI0007867C2E|nr:sigma-70 family RNA polymerase sigma factor [Demequina aestuarii]
MSRVSERLEAAVRANSDDLLAYLERRVGIDDAPDTLAEVMTVAWRRAKHLPTLPVEARMWLFGIARNVVSNAARTRIRRTRLADRLREVASAASMPAADDGVEVREAIAALDTDLSEIVRLRHWEGFSLAEIASILDEPASTVRSRYAKARDLLATALADAEPQATPRLR